MRSASHDFSRKATWVFIICCAYVTVKGWNIRRTHTTGSKRLQEDTAFTDSRVLRGLLSRGGNRSKQTTTKHLQNRHNWLWRCSSLWAEGARSFVKYVHFNHSFKGKERDIGFVSPSFGRSPFFRVAYKTQRGKMSTDLAFLIPKIGPRWCQK